MNVHIIKPYSLTKDLGFVYNEAMSRIPDGDWACLMDYDTAFLTPDCGVILHNYAEKYPEAGLLTCYTNRIHPKATAQLLGGAIAESTDLQILTEIAHTQRNFLYQATVIEHEVSGFLMMVSKATWNEVKFQEGDKCLGVDNNYCWDLFKKGKSIYRMDGLYVLHLYRLKNGITDKSHLR